MTTQKITRLLGETPMLYSDHAVLEDFADKKECLLEASHEDDVVSAYENQPRLTPVSNRPLPKSRRSLPVLRLDIDMALHRLQHIPRSHSPILPTPSEDGSDISPSPALTPTTPVSLSPLYADIVKVRRMRMTKLVRTLGEPVPAQFIAGPAVSNSDLVNSNSTKNEEITESHVMKPRRTQSLRISDSVWQDKLAALPSLTGAERRKARLRNSTSMVEMAQKEMFDRSDAGCSTQKTRNVRRASKLLQVRRRFRLPRFFEP